MSNKLDLQKLMKNKDVIKATTFFAELNKSCTQFSTEEWENPDIDKYYIYYDYFWETFNVGVLNIEKEKVIGCNYFRTEEQAIKFIDKHEKDLRKYCLNFKD